MKLDKFVKTTKSELIAMSESEIHSLNLMEKIERMLIINGCCDHEMCRVIEITDIVREGADLFRFTIICTEKRKRKPTFYMTFMMDEIHESMSFINWSSCKF